MACHGLTCDGEGGGQLGGGGRPSGHDPTEHPSPGGIGQCLQDLVHRSVLPGRHGTRIPHRGSAPEGGMGEAPGETLADAPGDAPGNEPREGARYAESSPNSALHPEVF